MLTVFDHYRTHHPRANPKPKSTSKEWRNITARFAEGYTADDLCQAIDGCHLTPFNMGENSTRTKYTGLELITRSSSHVNQFIEAAEAPKKSAIQEVFDGSNFSKTMKAMEEWANAEDEQG